MRKWLSNFANSSQMNGAIKAANKNIKKFLPFALYAYRTFVRTSTSATLYSLVYSMEAVLPAKV